jgi:2',3'-cyclic-nucleotide 2'-phosphodiesterase (5'-nucleotidase family)
VDIAMVNSGGVRADLTCPAPHNPTDFCPPFAPPPFPITRGQVLTLLPFGNIVVTVTGGNQTGATTLSLANRRARREP